MESAVLAYFLSVAVLDATTTSTERKKLTVGRMALLFPFMAGGLARLATTDDEDEARALAQRIRDAILHAATDTNPKRTRAARPGARWHSARPKRARPHDSSGKHAQGIAHWVSPFAM